MIRSYMPKDYNEIVALWQEAFGDSTEDIDACLAHFSPYLTVYTKDEKILGMFMMLPLTAGRKKGYYIYAVATARRARGKGIATELLAFAKKRIEYEDKQFLALVPAKPSLFSFYKERGYTAGAHVTKNCYTCKDIQNTDVTVKQITPKQMNAMRKAHFKKQPFAAWDEKMLTAIDKIYGGCYYELCGKGGRAFCMAYPCGDKVVVSELCLNGLEEIEAVSALSAHFSIGKIEAVLPDKNGEAFAMFYPAEYAELYFNIAIN